MHLVLLLAGALLLPQSLKQHAYYAKLLYIVEYGSDFEEQYKRDHRAALKYLHSVANPKLKSDMTAVLQKYKINTNEGAGAAYLMAMRGIDTQVNVHRLSRMESARMDN